MGGGLVITSSITMEAVDDLKLKQGDAAYAVIKALVYLIGASLRHHDPILILVLAGVVIGSLLGSSVGLIKYVADPYNQLPAITMAAGKPDGNYVG